MSHATPPAARAPARQADWPAAALAGLGAGLIFLAVNAALAEHFLGTGLLPLRLAAALALGDTVLPPSTDAGAELWAAGLAIHLLLSVGFTAMIAFCLHRWGILVGLLGGALFGLGLYTIDYYFVADYVQGFSALRGWLMGLSHVIFGATAGGLYEAFERDHR